MQFPWLDVKSIDFPEVQTAAFNPDGLLAIGGDLSVRRLIRAYRLGIFPWFNQSDPILWWAPTQRAVITPASFHISKSLRKTLRASAFHTTCDKDFMGVVQACAAPRIKEKETWITNDMQLAYQALHDAGVAHSVEVWQDDLLVGGIYGVCLGHFFFGESMFSEVNNASKIALAHIFYNLTELKLLDCQIPNPHLMSLGAFTIPRENFIQLLKLELLNDEQAVETSIWPKNWKNCL
ncbi:MAG: leucyl/phenylalanyl-tRNA--protein transferase [Pseudomonadota bacterium]